MFERRKSSMFVAGFELDLLNSEIVVFGASTLLSHLGLVPAIPVRNRFFTLRLHRIGCEVWR
jgi:hypothetical protein